MLSAVSYQNSSSINFCRGSVREDRVIKGLLKQFTKVTNAAAREEGISLFEASNKPSQLGSRLRYMHTGLKNRCTNVGKMRNYRAY